MNKKQNKGFTLIELLVVIAIISLLSTTVMASLNQARQKSRDAKRISDMKAIQTALEMYYNDNNHYPIQPGWTGECAAWNQQADPNNIIPGLVPTYLGKMPSAPMMNKTGNTDCYLYTTDAQGLNYALLSHNSTDINYSSQPSLVDPIRDNSPDCTTGGSYPFHNCDCSLVSALDNTKIWSWKIASSPAIPTAAEANNLATWQNNMARFPRCW